eukprot:jgi/Botrbrau1/22398/Bobra.0091s0007.3
MPGDQDEKKRKRRRALHQVAMSPASYLNEESSVALEREEQKRCKLDTAGSGQVLSGTGVQKLGCELQRRDGEEGGEGGAGREMEGKVKPQGNKTAGTVGRIQPPNHVSGERIIVSSVHTQDQDDACEGPGVQEEGDEKGCRPAKDCPVGVAKDIKKGLVRKVSAKAAPVLPWMRLPIAIREGEGTPVSKLGNLHPSLAAALEKAGFNELFPVQATSWKLTAGGSSTQHDLCICAPTGSGKTLAYALPIIQALSRRIVPHLCALVVLPTRDLSLQVFSSFAELAPSVGLRVALMAGRAGVPDEARAAVGDRFRPPADIVVATPGRLMAHLAGTQGFNLNFLRFLVVDEADRLLRQAYQDWLPHVVSSITARMPPAPRVVKVVVSATLTKDPSKIGRLELHWPRFLAVEGHDSRYRVPQGLQERWVTCRGADKPAVLLALLEMLAGQKTIVFGNSVESTHRLQAFLGRLPVLYGRVAEYSRAVSNAERFQLLSSFQSGSIKVLVASDAITRGMDIADVDNIINYEPPVYAKTYVHRAGRTARAGKQGWYWCSI